MKFLFTIFAAILLYNSYGWCSDEKESPTQKSRVAMKNKKNIPNQNSQNIPNNELYDAEIRKLIESAVPPKVRRVVKVDQVHDVITYLGEH